MEQEIQDLKAEAIDAVEAASSLRAVEDERVRFLGKSGSITKLGERMRTIPKEERPAFGKLLNELRTAVTEALDSRKTAIAADEEARELAAIDVTLPGIRPLLGAHHPLTQLEQRAVMIFRRMGFAIAEGPDIETEWHCFDALNTPADHPARNEQDTFYLPDGRLLRTHTSSVQIRTMETTRPPIRIIAPGAAYRRDEVDATHLSQFSQMEGLYIDRDVSIADLKGTLEFFFQELFGEGTDVRFRPHFFPFTEPSFEIDIRAEALGGKWMELAGCGMVDPALFESVSKTRNDSIYDPEQWSGFAFGFGLDRLAMNLSGIPDIRMLTENDLRFLKQF